MVQPLIYVSNCDLKNQSTVLLFVGGVGHNLQQKAFRKKIHVFLGQTRDNLHGMVLICSEKENWCFKVENMSITIRQAS